jgi:hypothetical protein
MGPKFIYLGEVIFIIKTNLDNEPGDQVGSFHEKDQMSKVSNAYIQN